MHPLVEQAEALFGSDMERLASDTQKRFPEFRFNLWRGPVGSLTEYQGYDIGVECVFQTIGPHDSESVSLSVELCHLTSTPKVMASVNWNPTSAHPGKQFRDDWQTSAEWPDATPEVMKELAAAYHDLVLAFELAVESVATSCKGAFHQKEECHKPKSA